MLVSIMHSNRLRKCFIQTHDRIPEAWWSAHSYLLGHYCALAYAWYWQVLQISRSLSNDRGPSISIVWRTLWRPYPMLSSSERMFNWWMRVLMGWRAEEVLFATRNIQVSLQLCQTVVIQFWNEVPLRTERSVVPNIVVVDEYRTDNTT